MKPETPSAWLHAIDAFSELGQPELRRLLARCFTQTVERGVLVVEAGEAANALHVLISGRLAVQEDTRTDELAPGAVVGDAAFFRRGTYPRNVVAARDSLVLTLEWDEFTQLADRAPEYWQAVAVSLAKRVSIAAEAAPQPFPKPRSLAIIGAGPAPLQANIANDIAAAFDPLADCQVLRSVSFGQNLPGGITLDDPEVAHWLREQQQAFDLIIRMADNEVSEWTRNAILEADEIILVGSHGDGRNRCALNAIETLAFELRGAHACRLVLVSDGQPEQVRAHEWLALRPVRFHHRIRVDAQNGFDRLARFVLGRATGYIACGGGAYAAAHLGLVEALIEAGVTIDCVGGAGAGAFVAAHIAQETPFAEAARFFPPLRARADFERAVSAAFGDLDIVDTALPYRALSADLTSGVPVVHSSGLIVEAVLANWPPPGLAAPFISQNGAHLADGGLIDSAPAWLLNDVHSGPVILGRIEPPLPLSAPREAQSAKDWAIRRITGARDSDGGGPFDVANLMLRGMALRGSQVGRTAALSLSPPLRLGSDQQDTAREAAYQWALTELERLKATGESGQIFNR